MTNFAKVDLSQYRQDIASGAEIDHNGHHIYKCAKGSIGRFIKDAQKQKYSDHDKNRNGQDSRHKIPFPKARTLLAVEYYGNNEANIWDKRNPEPAENNNNYKRVFRRMDVGIDPRKDDSTATNDIDLESLSTKSKMKTLVENPSKFYSKDRYQQPGSHTYVKSHSMTNKNEYSNMVEKIQRTLLEKTKSMPLFITRAMFVFTDEENIHHIGRVSETEDILKYEEKKSNSDYVNIFVDSFFGIAQRMVEKYHKLLKMARDLGNMNPEDMRINNPKNLPLPIQPIKPGNRSLDEKDEAQLEKEIIIASIERTISILQSRKKQLELDELELDIIKHPQPIGGSFLVQKVRENEFKKKNYRVCAKMVGSNDPKESIWDYDPGAYEEWKRMNSQQTFDYLIPKRQREKLLKRLGKSNKQNCRNDCEMECGNHCKKECDGGYEKYECKAKYNKH